MTGLFQRIFLLSNGNRLLFSRNPPFGHWSVNYAKGGMPHEFQGMFTSYQEVYRKVEVYLAAKRVTILEEEPWLEETGRYYDT